MTVKELYDMLSNTDRNKTLIVRGMSLYLEVKSGGNCRLKKKGGYVVAELIDNSDGTVSSLMEQLKHLEDVGCTDFDIKYQDTYLVPMHLHENDECCILSAEDCYLCSIKDKTVTNDRISVLFQRKVDDKLMLFKCLTPCTDMELNDNFDRMYVGQDVVVELRGGRFSNVYFREEIKRV